VVVLEGDGWVAKQLRDLAAESRWLVRAPRTADSVLSLVRAGGPAVLLVQFDPGGDAAGPLGLIADARRLAPDVPAVAVADAKLPDAERAAWTAAVLDLGARCVLFPPLTRPVLEDVVSGLMAAAVRRATGGEAAVPPGGVIDLADEDGDG
jgi:hypothetical protein